MEVKFADRLVHKYELKYNALKLISSWKSQIGNVPASIVEYFYNSRSNVVKVCRAAMSNNNELKRIHWCSQYFCPQFQVYPDCIFARVNWNIFF